MRPLIAWRNPDRVITGDELGLPFDPRRFLRWLLRKGLLGAIGSDKCTTIVGFRIASWPPPKKLLNAKPIGSAYHVQKWFGSYLQAYITSKKLRLRTG